MAPLLQPLPDGFAATVGSLHRVAEQIVAPARKPDNEIALEPTPGGFGTPVFEWEGARHQVRVEGAELVHEVGHGERRVPLASLADAARAVEDLLPDSVRDLLRIGQQTGNGAEEGDPPPADAAAADSPPADPAAADSLAVDPAAAQVLASWYAFGREVLQGLAAAAAAEDAASPAILWPEHFDVAIELGEEVAGRRATYGFSPGDENHAEPYAYVAPWNAPPAGGLWNATGFSGAELSYADLLASPDPPAAALGFLSDRRAALG